MAAKYSNYGEFTKWRVENGYDLPSHEDCWDAATELAVKNLTAHNSESTKCQSCGKVDSDNDEWCLCDECADRLLSN